MSPCTATISAAAAVMPTEATTAEVISITGTTVISTTVITAIT